MNEREKLIEAKNTARIKFHERHELNSNRDDFAFMHGFDAALSRTAWVSVATLPETEGVYLFYSEGMGFAVMWFDPAIDNVSWATHWQRVSAPFNPDGSEKED